MNQPAVPTPCGQPQVVYMPMPGATPTSRNGLGAFGFFLSLIGLLIPTGLVSILGLTLSLAAIGRAPRGLATGGVILGLIGSVFWLVITIGAIAIGFVAAIGIALVSMIGFALTQPEVVEITADMVNVALATEGYVEREKRLPVGLDDLTLGVAVTTDPWGNGYQLIATNSDPGFDVISAGPDGLAGTEDDVSLTGLDRLWERALNDFEIHMDELGRRFEATGHAGFSCDGNGLGVFTHSDHYESDARRAIESESLSVPVLPLKSESD